jgi:hypothetical protein
LSLAFTPENRFLASRLISPVILSLCEIKSVLTLTLDKAAAEAFADKHNSTDLAMRLEKIHYPATVTIEGEPVSIRVGQAPIRDVRRAVCHRIGWPLSKFKTDEIADRLKALWRWGARKVTIIGDTETMDVELGQDGNCQKESP